MFKTVVITGLVTLLAIMAWVQLTTAHQNNSHVIVPNPFFATPQNHGNCDWWASDKNHDCIHNVADTGAVSQAVQFDWDPPTYTATNTPTETFTPTNTPTNTPVPTFTNTPTPTNTPTSMFSVTELVNDSTNTCTVSGTTADNGNCVGGAIYPVQGSLCSPVPATYDWGKAGKGLGKGAPQGDTVTPWWTAQWNGCGDSTTGVQLIVDNFHAYGWTGGAWVEYGGNYTQWCGEHLPDTFGYLGPCSTSGGNFVMPTGQESLHGAYFGQPDQNVQCVVTVYRAKSTGAKDIMANAGADHKNGSTNLWDLFISRYKLLNTSTWTQVGGTSCTASTVQNNPPPNF